MESITQKDLEQNAKRFNQFIAKNNIKIVIGYRYGYVAIDLGWIKSKSGIIKTLITGLTKRQAMDYIWSMETGMDLLTNEGYKREPK